MADAVPAPEPPADEAVLDTLPPSEVAARIEHALALAVERDQIEAIPALLDLMRQHDPDRAERAWETLMGVRRG